MVTNKSEYNVLIAFKSDYIDEKKIENYQTAGRFQQNSFNLNCTTNYMFNIHVQLIWIYIHLTVAPLGTTGPVPGLRIFFKTPPSPVRSSIPRASRLNGV